MVLSPAGRSGRQSLVTRRIDLYAPFCRGAVEPIWFALRGLGLSDEAIGRYYIPKSLSIFFGVGNR